MIPGIISRETIHALEYGACACLGAIPLTFQKVEAVTFAKDVWLYQMC